MLKKTKLNKKPKRSKKSATRARPTMPEEIKMPGPGDWDNIVRALNLSATQSNELKITVQHAVEDIAFYRSVKGNAPARELLTMRLKRMEKALSALQSEINRSIHLMEHFLPHDTMQCIGRSFTLSAIGDALGRNVFQRKHALKIERMRAEGKQLTTAWLEELTRPEREFLGLKHGHRILNHFIASIRAPLTDWVKLDKLNKGGRTPQMARKHLISELAREAPQILGKPAAVSTTGSFATLCSLVLPACGLSAKGVEKALPGIVRQVRADETRRRPTGHS